MVAREGRERGGELDARRTSDRLSDDTAAGPRIRVRVGPFTSRDDADKARASARSAGLAAAVLAL